MDVIQARAVSVDKRVRAVDLDIYSGEMLGLIGPNGAGKSTLLNALAGIQEHSGKIFMDGEDVSEWHAQQRARRIALQPQFISSSWSLSVADIVSFGRIPWGDMDQEVIQRAMRQAGIDALESRRIDHLSGGERARVWVARMLANQADMLLMDEPVASLDIHYQHAVLRMLKEYAQQGHAVMIAIHDLSLAARYCDRLCLLNNARMVKSGSIDDIMKESLLCEVFNADIHVDLQASPPVVLAR